MSKTEPDGNQQQGGETKQPASDDPTCDCTLPDNDYNYIVTPFLEKTDRLVGGLKYPVFWFFFGLGLLLLRLGSMILCGEYTGRFFINGVFAILPALLAFLIVRYSMQTERMTDTFCRFICGDPKRTVHWCERQIRYIFDDRRMVLWGMGFVFVFVWFIPGGELFPTPANNAKYIQKVLDSTTVNHGVIRGTFDGREQTLTIGWSEITLGDVNELDDELLKKRFYKALHDPLGPTDTPKAEPTTWQWRVSQSTYLLVILCLLFMGGAMLWCLIGIVRLTWQLGDKKGVRVHIYPHPVVSIKSVGKFLGLIAVNNSIIYGVVLIGVFLARPDPTTFTLTAIFSIPSILIFLLPQYNLHKLMLKIKYDKISPLGDAFEQALVKAKQDPSGDNIQRAHAILELQHSLTMGSEWPFDLQTLITVIGSIAIPLVLGLLAYIHQA